ncbi:MAG TPA: MauE/DoxX family redox-associated membrane protein [Bacteroidia bacterium]|jgi:copper chaperone CopZ|nr:MauE/DoxX family redox-associated membrane protein [Bacteroidia bacterium]
MTHTYSITGMTCNGCASSVQQKLSKVEGVTSVNVNLEKQEAEITMQQHISTPALAAALAGTKYTLTDSTHAKTMPSSIEEQPVTLKTYLPIFLIFGYITTITMLIQYLQGRFIAMQWMSHFMAGFFLVFSFFKLLDVPGFAMSYSGYDIIAKRWKAYGYIYPFIELVLGISFLIPAYMLWSNAATLLVMSISIIGVLQSVLNKQKIQCACLGAVFNLPMSTVTIIEDAIMIVMSGISLWLITN